MNDREREHRDNQLMQLGAHYDGPIPGLSFIVPKACTGTSGKGTDDKAPGIWLRDGKHTNDQVSPEHTGRLLTPKEAIDYAAVFDRLSKPKRSGMRNDGYPQTYEALVALFYEVLGERLDRAIDQAEDRRVELREARAALTRRT